MKQKALVTGSRGFVGGYLTDLLGAMGHEIYTFDIKDGQDFRDYEQVRVAIDDFRPDWIFHIGALAYIPESFLDPVRAFETNTIGSLNILEAVRQIGLKTRIHLCGTSEEYGDSRDATEPITETTIPHPQSPYAIAKIAMDYLGQLYAESYNMNVVITRTFNHTGPGRGEQYAESAFAKQIVEIEQGKRDTLRHGNLEPIRNYTDVRDVVKAYVEAIKLPSGVYNICSDVNVEMVRVLELLMSKSEATIVPESDVNLFRPSDFSFKKPSCEKFQKLTGWKPTYTLARTLSDILNYWRKELE